MNLPHISQNNVPNTPCPFCAQNNNITTTIWMLGSPRARLNVVGQDQNFYKYRTLQPQLPIHFWAIYKGPISPVLGLLSIYPGSRLPTFAQGTGAVHFGKRYSPEPRATKCRVPPNQVTQGMEQVTNKNLPNLVGLDGDFHLLGIPIRSKSPNKSQVPGPSSRGAVLKP